MLATGTGDTNILVHVLWKVEAVKQPIQLNKKIIENPPSLLSRGLRDEFNIQEDFRALLCV